MIAIFFLHAPLLCVGDSMYCTLCCYVHFPPPVLCSVQSFLFQDLPSVELSGDSFIYIFALSL